MVSYFIDEALGYFIKNAGDMNGDNYDDIMIGSWYNWSNGIGRVYIFYGGATISEAPDITIMPRSEPDCMLNAGDGIGDINEDGYDDIVVSYSAADTNFARIYYGAANLILKDTVFYTSYLPGDFLNINVLNDINGDGKKEIGIMDNNLIKIFNGLEYYDINLLEYDGPKYEIYNSGDINNDGYNDFVCCNTNHLNSENIMVGGIWVYYGGNMIDTIPVFHFEGENKSNYYGNNVTDLGDINKEGYSEFAVLSPRYPDFDHPEGKLYISSMLKITGIEKGEEIEEFTDFQLEQNYPNPFNPSTNIIFTIPAGGYVLLEIYNILGETVKVIANGYYRAGKYKLNFNGTNMATGVYFYSIYFNNSVLTKKMILLR